MMGGLRNWLFLDEHAEEVRQRDASWEHHEPKEVLAVATAEREYHELRALIGELHETEEELRYATR